MAFSESILIDNVILQAQAGQDESSFALGDADAIVRSLIESCLHQFSKEIAGDPAQRGRINKLFELEITDGAADVPSDMLDEWLDQAAWSIESVDLSAEPMARLVHYADFNGYLLSGFTYYCLANGRLYFRNQSEVFADGARVTCYAPRHLRKQDLSTFPEQWQDRITDLLVRALLAKG